MLSKMERERERTLFATTWIDGLEAIFRTFNPPPPVKLCESWAKCWVVRSSLAYSQISGRHLIGGRSWSTSLGVQNSRRLWTHVRRVVQINDIILRSGYVPVSEQLKMKQCVLYLDFSKLPPRRSPPPSPPNYIHVWGNYLTGTAHIAAVTATLAIRL